jgi:hypothetical protein
MFLRGQIGDVLFSPEQRSVLVATSAGVRAWDLQAASWKAFNLDHAARVIRADLNSNGFLVTGGRLSAPGVRVWNLTNPSQPVVTLSNAGVEDVAIDDAGNGVYYIDDERRIHFVDLRPQALMAKVCLSAARPLTQDEWRDHLSGREYAPACASRD